jgi:hypothetical protein
VGIIVASLMRLWQTSVRTSKPLRVGVGTASRERFVYAVIRASHAPSSGAVIFIEIWCMWPFLVGVRVKVLHSCGMSYRSIGFPVWMLRKMYAARERLLRYSAFQRGSLGITASSALVSFPTIP